MFHFYKHIVSVGLLTISAFANALEVGKPLPPLAINSIGEYVIDGSAMHYRPWNSDTIRPGSPALIFHIPARMTSDAIIDPLRDRLDAEAYDAKDFQSISVVNLAEAMWGTAGMVTTELAKNKRNHPAAVIVADDAGRGVKAWNVQPREVVVALVDSTGNVSFVHKGKMSHQQVEDILNRLNNEIAKSREIAAQ